MYKSLLARLRQGHRTMAYPARPAPALPDRFRGRPLVAEASCPKGCAACVSACPTAALTVEVGAPRVDLGACLFCPDCAAACPSGALRHGADWRLATGSREALRVSCAAGPEGEPLEPLVLAEALRKEVLRLFGRSLRLREVSAGGCNACEADVNVLSTIGWDIGRFGIQMVASPRHADGLLVTGPVSRAMDLALRKTWDAIPGPKIAIGVGSCAISGGLFRGRAEVEDGAGGILPLDLYVPGCPPHPLTILDGLLRLLGRL